jgi:hypothetical protein
MKTYTNDQAAAIKFALQSNDLAINAVRQLHGDKAYDVVLFRKLLINFKRDCIRLGLGKVYAEKYHQGRKANKCQG